MKNVHIIPTDKPSRLRIGDNRNFVFGLMQSAIVSKNDSFTNQNIYITSNEEIKDCWGLNTHTNEVYFLKGFYGIQPMTKKIILTTDQSLDGVQAIDDEFLEWFVNNPSCEEVEIQCRYNFYAGQDLTHYKIIIPKEEPKQHLIDTMKRDEELGLYEEPKQETIEEAAEKYIFNLKINMMRNVNVNEPQNQQSCQTSVISSFNWIDTNIKTPEVETDVLCCLSDAMKTVSDMVFIGYINEKGKWCIFCSDGEIQPEDNRYYISHWCDIVSPNGL